MGYAGYGQECAWNAQSGSCLKGYAGDLDFHCMIHDATSCDTNGSCFFDATQGCVSRASHPGGLPNGNYAPSLEKEHAKPPGESKNYANYFLGGIAVVVLFGFFITMIQRNCKPEPKLEDILLPV